MKKATSVADVFVPVMVLEEIIKGSYEQVAQAVKEAVEKEKELFKDGGASLVATFSGYAIVATPSGKFFRVRYESKGGLARLQDSTPMNVPVMKKDTAGAFVRKEARRVVERFFSGGLTEDTRNHLHDVADAIISGFNVTPEGAAGAIVTRMNQEQRWKQYVEDPGPVAIGLLESDPREGFTPSVKVRFQGVLSGDYDLSKADEYRAIALGAMKELAELVEGILKDAKRSESGSFTLKKEMMKPGADLVVDEFQQFLKSFASDIFGLSEDLQEYVAVMNEDRLESIASLHDAIAEKVGDVELGGVFVRKFATCFEAA